MDIELFDVADPHVHVREIERAVDVLPISTAYCAWVLLMPNVPPLITGELTMEYNAGAEKIIAESGHDCGLIPCMMLDDSTTPEIIRSAHQRGVRAAKLYPLGATTRDENQKKEYGVSNIWQMLDVFKEMERLGMILCLHGEKPTSFCLYREQDFFMYVEWLEEVCPRLRKVLEHITTKAAVGLVLRLKMLWASITMHHILDNLDVVLGKKLDPHAFCKPPHKFPHDQEALLWAATSGSPKFFLGSDSAPHSIETKECHEGCAGAFTAKYLLPMLDLAFRRAIPDPHIRQTRLQYFVSTAAMLFYELARKGKRVILAEQPSIVEHSVKFGTSVVVHYRFGLELPTTLVIPPSAIAA